MRTYNLCILKGDSIMNEETKNEIMELDNDTEMEVYDMEPEDSGSGILGKVLIGAGVLAAGAVALAYKNRDKLEERRIKKLEKKGYIITKAEVVEDEDYDFDDDFEEVVEETEEKEKK